MRVGIPSALGGRGRTVAQGGRRASVTLADQAMASVSNFAVGVVVARVAGPAGLGGFSFAYAGWLVVSDMHRSLITDPMSIEGDFRSSERHTRIRRGVAAELALGTTAGLVFVLLGAALTALGEGIFASSMFAVAVWLPFLLLQDFWRWVGFLAQKPGAALMNDVVFNLVQAATFGAVVITGTHSIVVVIAAWGIGGLAGAAFGLRQNRLVPRLGDFPEGLRVLRQRWSLSKWLAGTALVGWGANQAYVFVAAAMIGPAGLGGLRAAQTLVAGPSGVLIQAGGSIGLPEATKAYAEGGWSRMIRVSRIVTAAGFASLGVGAAVIIVWGRQILAAVYGPAFEDVYWQAVLFAVGYLLIGFFLGPVLVLKATRCTQRLFYVQVFTLAVSLASVAALAALYGATGAAAATIFRYGSSAVGYRWYQRVVKREIVSGEDAETVPAGSAGTLPAVIPVIVDPP